MIWFFSLSLFPFLCSSFFLSSYFHFIFFPFLSLLIFFYLYFSFFSLYFSLDSRNIENRGKKALNEKFHWKQEECSIWFRREFYIFLQPMLYMILRWTENMKIKIVCLLFSFFFSLSPSSLVFRNVIYIFMNVLDKFLMEKRKKNSF